MSLLRRFLDRRRDGQRVEHDRRRMSSAGADAMLAEAIADMERTQIRRKAFKIPMQEAPANDSQRQVKFDTFAAICEYRVGTPNYVVCKHPEHEAKGTGIPTCNDRQCPFLRVRK